MTMTISDAGIDIITAICVVILIVSTSFATIDIAGIISGKGRSDATTA